MIQFLRFYFQAIQKFIYCIKQRVYHLQYIGAYKKQIISTIDEVMQQNPTRTSISNPNQALNQVSKLSRQFLKNLYETKCSSTPSFNPVLQILAFQQSLHEPHSQIIVRLSDGVVFVDCSLIGPYSIHNNKLISIDSGQSHIEFNMRDLVRLNDFFSKIDNRRICQLRIMIIRMELAERMTARIGYPAELRQYFQNMKTTQTLPEKVQNNIENKSHQKNGINKSENQKQYIKIEDDIQQAMKDQIRSQDKTRGVKSQVENKNIENPKTIQQSLNVGKKNEKQQSLTYQEILQGKQGYFLGRLLRMKMANKQTKQGPMSVLYLGFIDRLGQLVRVNMAGRLAMKLEKQLKKGKCYYLKDLEVFQTQKMSHPQLRLKDKQCKIVQVQQTSIIQKFAKTYYHWQHQNQSPEIDNVDIVGIIDDISQKKVYPHSNQKRQVVRVIVRNKFKTVPINFWAEQIKVLSSLKLKKRESVIFEDIKKKKNIFFDFQYESTVIKLDQNPTLKQELKDYLPQSLDPNGEPKNISQLAQIYQSQQNSNKTRVFRLYLMRMQENRIIYKLCSYCKRKVQRYTQICAQCNRNQFFYKYNCHLEFADFTGSISCVAFEFSAQRLLGKTAAQISEMNNDELLKLIDDHMFKQYEIGIENREARFIVRNAEAIQNTKQLLKISKENIQEIGKIMNNRMN